ncbi:recyclin-1 [Trichomonascus vanleenenianus]|uniref:Rcy1p n=1 Tax=Trichomonascus vanleenenianus TaxID=2268995 RepID=UPI003ECB10FB
MSALSFEPLKPKQRPRAWFENDAIVERIVERLGIRELVAASQVSRTWRRLAGEEYLWAQRLYNLGMITEKQLDDSRYGDEFGDFESAADKSADLLIDTNALSPLNAIESIKYRPGEARKQVLKLYSTLGPYYYDLVNPARPAEPLVFEAYRDPMEQAKLLSQLRRFVQADPLEQDHEERVASVMSTLDLFENAVLAEFEQAIDDKDAPEKIKEYAEVLITLNGGDSCVQLYTQKNPLLYERSAERGQDYFDDSARPALEVAKLRKYFEGIADKFNVETKTIDSIFPITTPVTQPLFERVLEDNIMDLVSSIIDYSRTLSTQTYLSVVPQAYSELRRFRSKLKPGENSGPDFAQKVQIAIDDVFGLHLDLYLAEELQAYRDFGEGEVEKWNQKSSASEEATETFLWSNVSREQDKSDFLTSFKKVLMMPVMPFQSAAATPNPAASASASTVSLPVATEHQSAPQLSPQLTMPSTPKSVPPTTELDAMVAVMNNKLESINTLFSLELALTIIKGGRDSIDRMAKFTVMYGKNGQDAREQCEQVFVELVRIVGGLHVQAGFDRALETLTKYNPRKLRRMVTDEANEERSAVEPLAIFAELVNIGDLIQQMIHVFFDEELVQRKYIDPSDFLSPAVKSKKRFEQALDDSVANGLNLGIDVLVDQIEFLLMTTQLGSDYNPDAAGFTTVDDLGPTSAAKKAVALLRSHVTLLVGSTEKSIIDVFQQEIGVRFFGSLCKHIKRQTISTEGAIKLISDINYYYDFILSLKQKEIVPYFAALKEVGQLFLIDGSDGKAIGKTLGDMARFRGVLQPEEVFEFVRCRADWLQVRRDVERVMYGFGVECVVM